MPELPEVETIRIGLQSLLPGKTVKKVEHDWPKSFPNSSSDVKKFLIGAKITDVRRRAKVLIIDLSSNYSLITHLKMTGQLVFVPKGHKLTADSSQLTAEKKFGGGHPSNSLVGRLPDKSTRVILEFNGGAKLFFNDQRKFGWMRLLPTIQVPEIDFIKKLGPEPLEDAFTPDIFIERINRRQNSPIKAVILDQTVLAGVGNIYADESLWLAKIHPATPVKKIPKNKRILLYRAIRDILTLSIKSGGSSDKNYVNAEGKKGSYLKFAQVFRRDGQTCPRCGIEIIKIRVAGRGTHICPKEQRLPRGVK